MIYYALVFLIVGLIAGALGVTGVAAVASQIAWVLFLIGIVLLLVDIGLGVGLRRSKRSDASPLVDRQRDTATSEKIDKPLSFLAKTARQDEPE